MFKMTPRTKVSGHNRTTKSSKRDIMYARIAKHGANLIKIFKLPASTDPIALSKKLRRLEVQGNYLAERYANGAINETEFDIESALILKKADAILGFRKKGIPVYFNGDPRGHALKIDDSYVRAKDLQIERDWGGCGLISPDYSQ